MMMPTDSIASECGAFDAATPRHIVGIGASAGGLESLEKLFRNVPSDTGMAFVVLQHLSPDFKSMMLELLGRDTTMNIHRAEDGMVVRANSLYLLPPKKEMVIADGRLRVTDKDRSKGLALPIDHFLESLARECGSQAIAIILSGSGSDGSRGVIEIARHGGFVISESPKTAKFDGMPSSAQASGVVDEILVPEEIGDLLVRIATEQTLTRNERIVREEKRQDSLHGIESIYQLFRRVHDIDFSVYKDTTVLRRIDRRLKMVGSASLDDYARRLHDMPGELDALYGDLLIGVTQFFRDPETYGILNRTIFPELVAQCDRNRTLRAWISGCATGEEPYSIAIGIHEAFEQSGRAANFKLFATDVHKSSLEHAGRGIYRTDELANVSKDRLNKFFVPRENGFQVSPEIRKSIVFAPHNVLSDAPFTDLDFVSCRNLLIYFQPVAQNRALSMFHYALRKGGILLLGGSESPGELAAEFDVVHERERIYKKRRAIRLPSEFRAPVQQDGNSPLHASSVRSMASERQTQSELHTLQDLMLNRFMPASLLIDENRVLVDSFGGAEKFLRLQARKPSLDVLDLMDEALRTTLSGAIGRTSTDNSPIRFSNVILRCEEQPGAFAERAYNLTITPLSHPSINGKHHIIAFEPLDIRPSATPIETETLPDELDASRDHIRQLEIDLRYSRENLQSTIEELETSNEELQATNEELIASNEELQSTNEELHSVNEELYTVNSEHQHKISELAELNQDMNHLLDNTDVATVFLDRDLRVRRFTSRVESLFDFVSHDIGRPIRSFLPKFAVENLVEQLNQVIHHDRLREYETVAEDGTSYLMRMLPYRIGGIVEGVVLMLVDVSSLEVLRDRLRWMSAIVESTDDAIVGQDLDGIITTWNFGAQCLYGYAAEEIIGKDVSVLIPEERRGEVVEYRQAIAAGDRIHSRDSVRVTKGGSIVNVSLTVSPVYDRRERLIGISTIARDVSGRIAMENAIHEQVAQRESFLATLSHELRNPLGAAFNACRLIRDDRVSEMIRNEAVRVVERQIEMTRSLLADLLDMSRISQGKINLKSAPVDLCELVDHVRETVVLDIQKNARNLVWTVPDEPLIVSGDATRLVQVQVNLISNAAKYSSVDSDVCVKLSRIDDWATIEVTDTGVGIAADQLESIFEPFVQVSATRGQSDGGLGVGLTLVKALVEEHGGRVEARSDGIGCGSTFCVFLPIAVGGAVAIGSACATQQVDTLPEPVVAKSRRIVLIEDLDDSRQMLTAILSLEGHKVIAQPNGESGVEAILANEPDLALVDIGLPGFDGYEVARRVRASGKCQETILVALTGFGQQSDIDRAHDAGFDHHMVKPIEPDRLTDFIGK